MNAACYELRPLIEVFYPQVECDLVNYIDYDKTEFYETEWTFDKCPIKLDSYEHFVQLISKDTEAKFGVKIHKLVMNDDFDRSIDIFYLLPFDLTLYISERLKNIIEQNNISGVKIGEKVIL